MRWLHCVLLVILTFFTSRNCKDDITIVVYREDFRMSGAKPLTPVSYDARKHSRRSRRRISLPPTTLNTPLDMVREVTTCLRDPPVARKRMPCIMARSMTPFCSPDYESVYVNHAPNQSKRSNSHSLIFTDDFAIKRSKYRKSINRRTD